MNRHGEGKRRFGIRVPSRPNAAAVVFDDRLANGQPHAHAAILGGKKRLKNKLPFFIIDSDCA
jgi:hypothetical protein